MTDITKLDDVTFLMSVRIDSMMRLENLILVVEFLTTHFKTHIHILEASSYNNHILKRLLPKNVSIQFIEDHDPVFHRTKYNNFLIKNCRTPLLAIWDADVLVDPKQITDSIELLRSKKADYVLPHENRCLDTSFIIRELYLKTENLDLLKKNSGKMRELYTFSFGGAFLVNKTVYIEAGMDNEHFYGWGREDGERFNRLHALGYKYKIISGPLFHLTHYRGLNSKYHSEEQKSIKHSEILHLYGMSKNELEKEVRNWKWHSE